MSDDEGQTQLYMIDYEEEEDEEEEEEEEEEVEEEEVQEPTVSSLARDIHGVCFQARSVMNRMHVNTAPPPQYYQQAIKIMRPPPYQSYSNQYYHPPQYPPKFQYEQPVRHERMDDQQDYQDYLEYLKFKQFKETHQSDFSGMGSSKIVQNYYKALQQQNNNSLIHQNASQLYRKKNEMDSSFKNATRYGYY